MTRDEAYQINSDLINKGFLSFGLDLMGKFIVFKTVNDNELQLIKMCTGLQSYGYTGRFNLNFLVFSLLAVEGEYVLNNRERRIGELRRFIEKLPNSVTERILKELSILRMMTYDSLKFLEGYTYTNDSRIRWKVIGKQPPNLDIFTGVPGTEKLGLNAHQESWIYINRALDDEEEYNQSFNLTLFSVSSNNPKGARQARAKHEANVHSIEERRRKIAIDGYIEKEKKWRPDGWAAPVDTAEELVAELERQIHGIKDKHDIFMENYFKKLKENAEAKAREAKERIEEARRMYGDVSSITGEQRPLRPEEIEKVMSRMAESKKGVIKVKSDEEVSIEDKERFLKKVGSKVLTSRG